MNYFWVFFLSNLLEFPIYWFFIRAVKKQWSFEKKIALICVLNGVTHPIVFFVIMNLKFSYLQNILMAEGFAVLIEALLLSWVLNHDPQKCLRTSLLANLVSWQAAPILTFMLIARL